MIDAVYNLLVLQMVLLRNNIILVIFIPFRVYSSMVGTFLNSTILQVHSYSVIHQDIIGCITNLDKINVTKRPIKCKPASSSFWVKVF